MLVYTIKTSCFISVLSVLLKCWQFSDIQLVPEAHGFLFGRDQNFLLTWILGSYFIDTKEIDIF